MTDELDLKELARLADGLHLELSYFELPEGHRAGTLYIGSILNYGSIARCYPPVQENVGIALVKLISALPRLIELARAGQEAGKSQED